MKRMKRVKWTKEQLKNLKNNYSYYIKHKKEAESYFNIKWSSIRYKANKLNISKYIFSEKQLKKLREKYFYYLDHKEEAENVFKKKWCIISSKAYSLGITSMKINKNCGSFLGCYVAERVLSHVFKDVERMPNGNIGFDFICNKGFKIDVKSCCLNKNNSYMFVTKNNKIADYFLCVGFDNRVNLNPQHIWLINPNDISTSRYTIGRTFRELSSVIIKNNSESLLLYSKYELTNKLKETIECCTKLKTTNNTIKSKDEIIKTIKLKRPMIRRKST